MAKLHKLFLSIFSIILCFITLSACTSNSKKVSKKNIKTSTSTVNNDYSKIFNKNKVMNIKININENDFKSMLKDPVAEKFYSADVSIDGNKVKNVGFRTKGFSSLRTVATSNSNRYSFKIKFDKYNKNQTLNGLNSLVLNNSYHDPSYMREYFTYDALSYIGGITPYYNYANVYINNKLYGFYLVIESISDSFVKRTAANIDSANLYKADNEDCTLLNNMDLNNLKLKYGNDKKKKHIKKLIKTLTSMKNGNKGNIESILDVDSALKAIALNTVTGNYDSYNGSKAHNYYLLYDNGKFKFICWDFNMSIGGFYEDEGASVSVPIEEPVFNIDITKRPLISKLLQVDEYKEKYSKYLDELITYFEDFDNKILKVSSLIDPYVKSDPSAFYSYEKYKENLEKSNIDLEEKAKLAINPTNDFNDLGNLPALKNKTGLTEDSSKTNNKNNKNEKKSKSKSSKKSDSSVNIHNIDICQDVVSINDYMTQRINDIKTQLATRGI